MKTSKNVYAKTSNSLFYKEAEGLSEDEINDALIIYKEIKKRFNSHKIDS